MLLVGLQPTVGVAQSSGTVAVVTIETIAELAIEQTQPVPLFFGVAHVIVPPGTTTETAGTAGPRLIAVEAGTLTITTATAAAVVRATTPESRPPEPVTPNADVVLGPGDRFLASDAAIRQIRNEGTRPSVYLDAALFPPGPETVSTAFTTSEGISFQLLAGVTTETVPRLPMTFRLQRLRLAAAGELPSQPRDGPALIYVEAGSLGLEATSGVVHFSRSASPAPFSTSGPMKPAKIGAKLNMSAGASAYLEHGSAIVATNQRDVPATILMLAIRPASSGSPRR